MSQPDEQTFAAAPSHGWIWPLLLGVFGLVLVVTAMVPETPSWGQLAIGGLLTVLGLVTASATSTSAPCRCAPPELPPTSSSWRQTGAGSG